MEIIRSNIENLQDDKKAFYKLVKGDAISVQKMTDEQLDESWMVDAWVLYNEVNAKGEEVECLAILSGGQVLKTISKVFKESFFDIVDLMQDEPFAIYVTTGSSKSGRRYMNCTMNCD